MCQVVYKHWYPDGYMSQEIRDASQIFLSILTLFWRIVKEEYRKKKKIDVGSE